MIQAVSIASLMIAVACQTKPGSPVGRIDARDRIQYSNGVTAHRGNSIDFPENTIPAFRDAIEAGADWIECDIFLTADRRLAVIHDATTGRVGDRDLSVAGSTYEQLLGVDVATGFRKHHRKTIRECPPERIPLLEDVLRLVMAQDRTRVSIQPKMSCVGDALALVGRLNAQRWVGFNDGNLSYMAEVKRLAPQIPVFWDLSSLNARRDIATARRWGFEAIVLKASAATPDAISAIRNAGLSAGVWTVNREDDWKRFLGAGVDRIYTDRPRQLLPIAEASRFKPTRFHGKRDSHVQGICTDGRSTIFWSWTDRLVKTDLAGHELGGIPVAKHHGDLCFYNGRIYVAVNLGSFNLPAGSADSWIYVYDASSLSEIGRHPVPELVHGAGGVAYHDGRFMVVGGLPKEATENYVYEYDDRFRFQKRHTLSSGYTLMGIQTVTYSNGAWWFGCYGKPRILIKADDAFRILGKWEFDAAYGIAGLADDRLLVARDTILDGKMHACAVSVAVPDPGGGRAIVEDPDPRIGRDQ